MAKKEEKLDEEAYRLAIQIDTAQQAMENATARGNAKAAKNMREIVRKLQDKARND